MEALDRLREIVTRTRARIVLADARGGVELHMSLPDMKMLVANGELCIQIIDEKAAAATCGEPREDASDG